MTAYFPVCRWYDFYSVSCLLAVWVCSESHHVLIGFHRVLKWWCLVLEGRMWLCQPQWITWIYTFVVDRYWSCSNQIQQRLQGTEYREKFKNDVVGLFVFSADKIHLRLLLLWIKRTNHQGTSSGTMVIHLVRCRVCPSSTSLCICLSPDSYEKGDYTMINYTVAGVCTYLSYLTVPWLSIHHLRMLMESTFWRLLGHCNYCTCSCVVCSGLPECDSCVVGLSGNWFPSLSKSEDIWLWK